LVVDMTGLAAAQAAQLLEASNNDVSLAVALFFGEEQMPADAGLAAEPSTTPNGGLGPVEDVGSDDEQPGSQLRRETPKTQRKARRASKGRRGCKDAADEDDLFGSSSNYDQLSLMEAADEATLALEGASSPVGRRRRQQRSAPIPITPPSSSSRRGRASRQERASNGEAAESELAGSAGRRGERLRGDGASGQSAPARASGHGKHRHSPLGSSPVPSPPSGVSVGSPLAATEPYPAPGSASLVDVQQQQRRRGGGGGGLSPGEAAERVLSRVRWDPMFDEVRDELVVSWRKLAPCETRKSGEAAWSMRVQYEPCDTPFDEFMGGGDDEAGGGGGSGAGWHKAYHLVSHLSLRGALLWSVDWGTDRIEPPPSADDLATAAAAAAAAAVPPGESGAAEERGGPAELPEDLWAVILEHCRPRELAAASRACRMLAHAALAPPLWARQHEAVFGAPPEEAAQPAAVRAAVRRSEMALSPWLDEREDERLVEHDMDWCGGKSGEPLRALCFDGGGLLATAQQGSVKLWSTEREVNLPSAPLPTHQPTHPPSNPPTNAPAHLPRSSCARSSGRAVRSCTSMLQVSRASPSMGGGCSAAAATARCTSSTWRSRRTSSPAPCAATSRRSPPPRCCRSTARRSPTPSLPRPTAPSGCGTAAAGYSPSCCRPPARTAPHSRCRSTPARAAHAAAAMSWRAAAPSSCCCSISLRRS